MVIQRVLCINMAKSIINNSRDLTNVVRGLEKLMDEVAVSLRRLGTAKASITQPTDNQLLVWDESLSMLIDSQWQLPAADGAANEILYTDGDGNLGWVAPGAAAAAGADTQVQYNDGGIMGAEADFTYNDTTNTLTTDHFQAVTDFTPTAADGASLGTAALEFSDLYLADGGVMYLGDDQDVTLTHIPDTGLLLNDDMQLQFRDNAIYMASLNDGHLDLEADTQIDLNSSVYLDVCADAGADVNAFLVRDAGGIIDYRTGADLLADVSGDAAGAFSWNAQNLTNIGTMQATSLGLGIAPDATTILKLYRDDASTTSMAQIQQDGTGDASQTFTLTGGQSYAIGIDNSNSDKFNIRSGTSLGNNGIIIDSDNNVGIGPYTPTSPGKLSVYNSTTNEQNYGLYGLPISSSSVNGDHSCIGFYGYARAKPDAGVTNTGTCQGINGAALLDDVGTVSNGMGICAYTGDLDEAGTWNELTGITIRHYRQAATEDWYADLKIEDISTGGSVTSDWCIYSEHAAPSLLIHDLYFDTDSYGVVFGDDQMAKIYADGSDLIYNSQEVGAGNHCFTGGNLNIATCANAGTDTDKFLVLDASDNVDHRTGAEVLSDIGGASAAHGVTTGYIPYADGATSWDDSPLYNDGGDVGIGTDSPDGKLHVYNGSAGAVVANGNADELIIENGANTGMSIICPDASEGRFVFGTPSDAYASFLRWDYTDLEFVLGTSISGGEFVIHSDDGVEAMRIDSSGNVGIGTASPDDLLHIYEANSGAASHSDALVTIENNTHTGLQFLTPNTNRQYIFFGDPESAEIGYIRYDHSDNAMQFRTNGTAKLEIASDGTLNIATCANAGTDTDKFLVLDASDNVDFRTGAEVLSDIGGASAAHGVTTGYIPYADGATSWDDSPLYNDGGDVGIGTASPDNKLHVSVEDNVVNDVTYPLRITHETTEEAGSESGVGIEFEQQAKYGNIYVLSTIESLVFYPEGTGDPPLGVLAFKTYDENEESLVERLRIGQDGNVGIGTDSPDTKLHVYAGNSGATSHSDALSVIEDNTHTGLQFLTPNTQRQYIFFGDPESADVGYIRYDHSDNAMQFRTNGTAKLEIASDGTLNITTCANAGTDTDKFLVLDASDNVDFRTGAEVLSDIGGASAAHGVTTGYIPYADGATSWDDSPLYNDGGDVGIGTDSPDTKLHVAGSGTFDDTIKCNYLDILNSDAIILGADNGGDTRTDNTIKAAKIDFPHYDTDEEDISVLVLNSTDTSNTANYGGGLFSKNTVTRHNFYVGATNTTTTGSNAFSIASDGGLYGYNLKEGTTQANAGASESEFWVTSGHATLPDGVVMLGQ